MKYIIEPSQLKLSVQVYRKNLRYKTVITRFTSKGEVAYKEVYYTYFKYGVKRLLINLLDEAFFEGIRSSEIEVTNFTKLYLSLGAVKIHNMK